MAIVDNVLNFWDNIQNEVIGSAFLFYIVVMIAFLTYALKRNIHNDTTILLSFIWTTIFVAATGNTFLYVFSLLAVAIFYYFIVSQKIRRGG